jgi:probable phosphoglycerate mutase
MATGGIDQLSDAGPLANTYRVMRHGQSKANVSGVIVSSIDTDRRGDFGLSELGREQVLAAARGSGLTAGTLICSSDFARARQTAQLMRDCLGTDEVVSAPALRERYFGDFDGGPVAGYAQVWAADEAASPSAASPSAVSPSAAGSAGSGVETAAAVLERAAGFVAGLERGYSGRDILLVSHGDTLQILQAGFAGIAPSRHRTVPHLEVAEIRRLHLAPRPVTPP